LEINKKMRKLIFIVIVVMSSATYLNAQNSDKEIKFGGRIMYDMAVWGAEEMDNTGQEFRRVRFFSSGTMYSNINYKLQLEFAGGKIAFKDVFIELNKLPIKGNLRVGHFKEPLRLEALNSSKYITFMERGLPIAFAPERNTGAMYHTTFGDKLSIQSGVFRNSDAFGNDKSATNNVNVTSRITYLAMNDDSKTLHLGASNSIRKNSGNSYGFSSRAENHLGNKLMSVSFEDVDKTNILGGEIAYVNNALSVQAEYLQATVIGTTETALSSYYGQISYFLTGESRSYKSSLDGFSRVKPNNNYGSGGKGAIELVARTSSMDLTAANEGALNDITLGLNWYLNPHTRVMLNYVMGEMTKGTEVIVENAVMIRVQLDF
jgi:phosphate-selective porin OprO/OprP